MKAVYLRGVTSGVRVMGAFINAISHRLSVRVSESHDDLRYVRTVRNGAETISFCTRSWKTLVATLPRKINAGEVVFSAPLIFLSPFISFNSRRLASGIWRIGLAQLKLNRIPVSRRNLSRHCASTSMRYHSLCKKACRIRPEKEGGVSKQLPSLFRDVDRFSRYVHHIFCHVHNCCIIVTL